MGGSFNPPTLAHFKLMKEAVSALGADMGFFVPVSDAYLKRKMRHSHPPVVLSPEMRVRMLKAMCQEDVRLQVCEKEIGTIEPRTMPTLQALQEDYPDAELFFVMGADKLGLLENLTRKRRFLDDFKVVLYSREDDALEPSLRNNEVFGSYLNRIAILPQPAGTEGISSSKVRERMLSGMSCQDLLCPGVWELFKDFTSADFPDVVNRFKGEFDFMNNRFTSHFVWHDVRYRSAEEAYQTAGCSDDERVCTMESILTAKFGQNPVLMKKLKETGDRILLNGNNAHETFWGIDLYSWIGENHLGKIIMNIRDKEISR